MKNQPTIPATRADTDRSGICPEAMRSSGPSSCPSPGRLLWLHLRITVPSFISTSPGLLLMTVWSVVASVEQNGYSAPVISRHTSTALSELAVRQ